MKKLTDTAQMLHKLLQKEEWAYRFYSTLEDGVLFSSSLPLFCFFILVFNLKQKHEEGQRFPHYLQQKNDPLAICSCVLKFKRVKKK
jgi:hypothetical protein